jgi:pimeloyl-ACP methyl ester carboxylesterase
MTFDVARGTWLVTALRCSTVIALVAASACQATAHRAPSGGPARVSFVAPTGDSIRGDLYGVGGRGVVIIAHGGYSTRATWAQQAQTVAERGFRVLVFESRAAADLAAGRETACLYDEVCQAADVLAAVRYLRGLGANAISVIGGSMGGGAVAQASVDAWPNEIDRIVLLAPAEISSPERMKGRKLFITTRNDANASGLRLPGIQAQYDRTPEPKRFLLLEGSAHGQRIFLTDQGEAVMRAVMRFLTEP